MRARQNPRLSLRRDALLTVEESTIEAPGDETFKTGQFWSVVTLFDPSIKTGQPEGKPYNPWDRKQYEWYEKQVLGGVWARWDSEERYLKGKPGVVEFLAAGKGFGPDVLEAAAREVGVPLVLDHQATWEAKQLFQHYGGQVLPGSGPAFHKVKSTKPMQDSIGIVRRTAVASYNNLGSPHLPRYMVDGDSFRQDMAKVRGDSRTAVNPRRALSKRALSTYR